MRTTEQATTTLNPNDHLRSLFLLDPALAFLNHGSFGACPHPVFEEYQQWQREFERSPVENHARKFADLMRTAREDLGRFINADPLDLVFVANATVGVHIVARSLELGPGDEVLTTDHEYGACDRMWEFLRRKHGFVLNRVEIPVPVTTQPDIVQRVVEGMNDQTKVLFISHITSPTALTLPVEELCQIARERGIITLIDGAHSIGQIDLDFQKINPDFFTSNLHKWLCAPKGSAFLYARQEMQKLLHPLVVSWGWEPEDEGDSEFIDHHEYQGTREAAPALATGAAINFQREHDWPSVRERCHELVVKARSELSTRFGFIALSPNSPEWFVQMCAFLLPEHVDGHLLQQRLFDEYRVEIPVFDWNGKQIIRISIQGYNTQDDLERLFQGIAEILPELASEAM
ncbi:MAG: aminotransferase class V-fold PLP-dependent enzyme [Chlorobi bacterium]|nr:aminotransferase class V-fold PLP-dependent enzyme [Chlorobiota bacterium]